MKNNLNAGLVQKATGIKTYEVVQYVSGYMEGELMDWPPNIQDAILSALERKAGQVEHPLTIVHSRCDVDYADTNDGKDKFYVHVIASEIVAADARYMNTSKEEIKSIISDIVAGRRTIN